MRGPRVLGRHASARRSTEFGLDCYPQEFELCDHTQMLGYMAYSGMPSHYPHWSYGKAYEKLKTLYDHGVSGLPYEMVINSNPALAYLMRDNSLLPADPHHRARLRPQRLLQEQLHVPARRAPSSRIGTFKAHADRVRRYVDDPEHRHRQGRDHPRRRARAVAAVPAEPRRQEALAERGARAAASTPRSRAHDPFQSIHRRAEYAEPDLRRSPPSPEEDLLLFIRDHNPFLAELGAGSAHDRPRGGAVLHPADRDEDHERGLGLVLAQAHPRTPRAARRSCTSSSSSATTRSCARSRAASTRTTSASSSGRTSSAAATTRRPRSASATGPSKTGRDLLFETREVDRDVVVPPPLAQRAS